MKISCTWFPYFSKSFASLVTHKGAKSPTSLVQTTFICAAGRLVAANVEMVTNRSPMGMLIQELAAFMVSSNRVYSGFYWTF
jgi:hypothetical protein